jgi:beta-glucosidase
LKLSSGSLARGQTLDVSFRVTNAGRVAGKETAILYVKDEVAAMTPPAKRVRRFAKVALRPGEGKMIRFTLSLEDLQYIGSDNRPTIEPGDFTVMVGGLSSRFTYR